MIGGCAKFVLHITKKSQTLTYFSYHRNPFQRKSNALSMFKSFMKIFPVVDEFLPYFSSYLSKLTFFTQSHAKHLKMFGTLRNLKFLFPQLCVKN